MYVYITHIQFISGALASTYDMGNIPIRPRCSPSYQLLSICRMMFTASPFLNVSSLQRITVIKVPAHMN